MNITEPRLFRLDLGRGNSECKIDAAPGGGSIPAPRFSAKDALGQNYDFTEIIGENRYLDFWASWCGACRAEIPKLEEYAEKYSEKGFTIVSISLDKNSQAWLKAMGQERMPWLILLDQSQIMKKYKVESFPSASKNLTVARVIPLSSEIFSCRIPAREFFYYFAAARGNHLIVFGKSR